MPATPNRTIWITRPAAQAERTAESVRLKGFTPLIAPLLTEIATPITLPGTPIDGIILTSQNAAKYLTRFIESGELSASLPIYCVGERTASAARDAGFLHAKAYGQDAESLIVTLVSLKLAGKHLFYPAADAPRHDLTAALAPHGITVSTIVVYAMEPITSLSDEVRAVWKQLHAVLLYSPFTAQLLAGHLPSLGIPCPIFLCLSEAVAAAIRQPNLHLRIANEPTEHSLLQMLDD